MSDRAFDVEGYLSKKAVNVKHRQGDEVNVSCFFHDEDPGKRGRLYINVGHNPDLAGLYMCQVCGAKGNLVTLMRWFGDEAPRPDREDKDRLDPAIRSNIYAAAAEYYQSNLGTDEFKWLVHERGLTAATIKKHQLGWADGRLWPHLKQKGFNLDDVVKTGLVIRKEEQIEDDGALVLDGKNVEIYDFLRNCITIPYHITGNVVLIRGKKIGGKYLTPPKQDSRLFNSDATWDAPEVVVTEGEFDAMVVEQMGYRAVGVAGANTWQDTFTSYLSDARKVFLVFDNDKAGHEGAQKVKEMVGRKARIVEMPDGGLPPGDNDISEHFGKQGHTADEFEELLRAQRAGLLVTVHEAIEEWETLQGQGGLKTGYEKLDFLLEPGLLPGQVCIPLAKTNTGKGQPEFAKLLTPSGWKTLRDFKIGDRVVGSNGKATKVTGIFPRGTLEVYEVKFSDGSTLQVDGDHLWQVRGRKTNGVFKTLDLITKIYGDKESLYIPMVKPVEFDENPGLQEIDPYLLGLLLGDGGLRHRVMFSSVDVELLESVQSLLPNGMEVVHSAGCDYRLTTRTKKRNPLKAMLSKLNLHGKYSKDKFIPDSYKFTTPENRLSILQGLFDTDGSAEGSSVEYTTSSHRLALDVQFLVESLGGTARITRRGTTHLDSYRMYINLPVGMEPFRLSRKIEKRKTRQNTIDRRIISIEPVGQQKVICISVAAKDSLYVTEHCIVTHNTVHLLNLFQRMRMVKPDIKILFCSLEQTPADWFERSRRIYAFYNMGVDLKNVNNMTRKYWQDNLYMTGVNRLTEEDLLASVDDYQLETGSKPDVVAIDYLGYWAQSFHANSRYERVSDAVMSLKACAKDLKVPFIAPHQVSRGAEFGTEIDLSDSRDSGAIEETADFAFGMWNEDTRKGINPEDRKGEVNMRILKSRHGGKGHKITMQFGYCTLVMAPHEDPVATQFARDELVYAARGESWEDAMTRHKTGRKDGDLLSFTV